MRLFHRIVILTETGDSGSAILAAATSLASRFHSEFVLLHVTPHEASGLEAQPTTGAPARLLALWEHQLTAAGAASVRTHLLAGSAAHHLERIAGDVRATLVLLAEAGDAIASRAWFGTTSQKLVRRISIPVLVLRPGESTVLAPIVAYIDFSDSARRALHHAISLARTLACPLTILHVVPEPPRLMLHEGSIWGVSTAPDAATIAPGTAALVDADPSRRMRAVEGQIELRRYLTQFDLRGVKFESIVAVGSPVAQTLATARRLQAGLIVVGAGPRAGLVNLMTQSAGEALADMSDVPVMIFRATPERTPAAVNQGLSNAHYA